MDAKEQRILQEVEKLGDETIDLASRLVAEPSTLGNEASVMAVMKDSLAGLGMNPVEVPIDPQTLKKNPGFAPVPWDYENRCNVVAVRPADGQGGRSTLFNGHLDVVSPEPIGLWEHHPFQPSIKEGWLHGRGAGDMKAGIAAMTYAVHAVEKAGFGLKGNVTIETVIEEECSGNGALACMDAGFDAEAVLIPEPFGPAILTAQVGVLWFKVEIVGVPRHVLEASAGVNAVEKCYLLISALRELEEKMNEASHPAYRDVEHPLHLNVGIIKGGDWPSTVPAAAEFHCRLSYFPGMTFDQVRQKINQTIMAAAEGDPWLEKNLPAVRFYGFRSDGHTIKRDNPALATLNECHKGLTGKDAADYISTCTTDLRAFHFFGKGSATCYGPVAENIHAANERVNIESVIHTAKVYALFLAHWCGLVE